MEDIKPLRAVDVRKLHFPIGVVIAIVLAVVSGAAVWARTDDHVHSTTVHLDPGKVVEGGGVAYKNDINSLRYDIKWEFVNQERGIRKMLRQTNLTCMRWHGASCAGWRLEPPPEETP